MTKADQGNALAGGLGCRHEVVHGGTWILTSAIILSIGTASDIGLIWDVFDLALLLVAGWPVRLSHVGRFAAGLACFCCMRLHAAVARYSATDRGKYLHHLTRALQADAISIEPAYQAACAGLIGQQMLAVAAVQRPGDLACSSTHV